MYYVYAKVETSYDSRKLLGEYKTRDEAEEVIDAELAKDKDFKYILEKTTGHVDNYGELIVSVVDEN